MKIFSNWTKERWGTAMRIVRRYNANDGMTVAGALSFYFLMSILPMCLLGLAILGYFLGSERAAISAVTSLGKIGSALPEGTFDISAILETLISGKAVLGSVGLLLLVWFSGGVFYTIEVAVNKIFRTGQRRGFFHKTAVVYFFLLVAGVLLILSIITTVIAAVVSDFSVGLFGINPAKIPFLWSLLFTLVPPLLMMLLFMIIYKVGPTGGVKWSSAFNGALFAAILWEIFRRGLGWYFSTIAVYNKLYGAFGAFVAITIWIFYSANVFLIGAEYAAICNERTDKRHLFAKTKSEK